MITLVYIFERLDGTLCSAEIDVPGSSIALCVAASSLRSQIEWMNGNVRYHMSYVW